MSSAHKNWIIYLGSEQMVLVLVLVQCLLLCPAYQEESFAVRLLPVLLTTTKSPPPWWFIWFLSGPWTTRSQELFVFVS